MDYYEKLNKVIDKIEENLTEQIDYNELAKIVGTSSYTLQRIFVFLTDVTLTEYIRKRRLSNAAEELLATNIKVIDLAIKYQYDSAISFSNTFKKMYGISPQTLRKNRQSIKIFSKIDFKPITNIIEELEYRVVEKKAKKLYGITTDIIYAKDDKAIKDLYEKARKEKVMDFIIKNSDGNELYYGACINSYDYDITKNIQYYLLGNVPRKDFVCLEIPQCTWACFKLKNKNQNNILKLYNTIFTKWLPSSQYKEILNYPQLEIYYQDYCEICIPIQ